MNSKPVNNYQQNVQIEEDEIDLYELWQTLWKRRKFIFIFSFSITVLTAVISLFMTNIYKAESTILPVDSGSGMMGELAGMASLAGVNIGGGGDTATKVLAVANSRTVKEEVINTLGLTKIIVEEIPDKRDPLQFTLEKFDKLLTVNQDKKTSLITISFEWEDPKLAADITNMYVSVTQKVLESKALTINKMNRVFYEKQLKVEKARLSGKKQNLAAFQKRSKMIAPEEQAKGTMELYSTLMAQKVSLEVMLQGYEAALSSDNPRLVALKNQIKELNRKIKSLEGNVNEGALPSLGNAPDNIVEYTDILEGLKISGGVYEILNKLYEKAKLDEAKNNIYVEVIDEAIAPDKKEKPKRALMVVVAAFTSLFISVFIVFFMEWLESLKADHF